jgi:hypothetical protein
MSDQAMTAVQNLVITHAAAGTGADVPVLLDSSVFRTVIDSFDPAAADYHQKVSAAIVAAVAGDARFRVPAAPLPEAPAGPVPVPDEQDAAPVQWTEDQVRAASLAQLDQAMRAGLLTDLGIPVPKARR